MRLKKIELAGFKSFYHKTTLVFPDSLEGNPEITAIVGPNGSGKSNIADAIKWGLGGGSKKSFRGKKNLDVIFAGSPLKKPLSAARVTLFFDNSGKKIPVEFSEITISRKIYRSGENEYFLNNSRASLKEIVSLLGEAGIGRESYSIVNQGMADRLLAASPLERRKILEEAACVKHLEIKKEDSRKNLEETLFNLAKTEASLLEIKPRVESLEATAEKKTEEKALQSAFNELARRYFGTLKKEHQDKKEAISLKLEKEQKILDQKNQETTQINQELEATAKESTCTEPKTEELEKQLEKIRIQKNESERQRAISDGRIEIIKEKIKLEESLLVKKVDLPFVEQKLETILDKITLWEKKDSSIKEILEKTKTEILNLKSALQKGVIRTGGEEKVIELKKALEKEVLEIKNQEKEISVLSSKDVAIRSEIAFLDKKETEKKRRFYQLAEEAEQRNRFKETIKDRINSLKIEFSRLAMTEERQNEKAQRLLGKLPDFLDLKKEEELERKEILVADSQLEMLKRQLEVCDSIGEEVLKEYQETKERFIFLKEETKDIKETEKTLRKMIKELDKEINTRFSLTLEKVNGKFQKYFEIIFGGGQAELVLVLEEKEETEKTEYSTEEQNMPQGIEIKMSLPRKRIKSTSMLSGGEKTLTSLALLFAIISSNPPPFVLLDEVDASLDETNSANFTKVVKNMARHSQFIVITHNREIMKEVRLLYGVTLRKDGTSQLLSVDLEKRTPDNS